MKTILIPAGALCVATLAGLSAYAFPVSGPGGDPVLHRVDQSDGAGLPGLPGGRGGKSGRELAAEDRRERARYSRASDDQPGLTDYCVTILRTDGRDRGTSDFRPSDCIELFVAFDAGRPGRRGESGRRGGDGQDGASIDGGMGGQGGRSGGGPGGGRGGGGGVGVGGGRGGAGGAGGGGY
ncbi:hypothetical protein [Methylobacterium sp. Leaf118]|uniref:hypothetical protein n=1 Tax=Methylobacterium sp. Leaf118 TaxID=2876562 RepID=UPI001E2EF57A|nr:hypothetical protein [Methylobacterium sp. Leaf118]